MTFAQFLYALRARLGVFLVALFATVATASVVSFLLPKVYRATAAVVVDTRQEQSLSNSINALFSPQERAAYVQTQVDIITSERVAQDVVRRLELHRKPDRQEEFAEVAAESQGGASIVEWLAEKLLVNLEVETGQSAVINISYSAGGPEHAASVANNFARAYIDRVLELRVEPTKHAAAWFDEQLKTLRANLETAQSELTDFQQKHDIVSTEEGGDVGYTQLAELSSQVVRAREETIDLESRRELAERLERTGASLDVLPEVQQDTLIRELRSSVENGEVRLEELAVRYGENHPEYKQQVAKLASSRERLQEAIDKVVAAAQSRAEQGRARESGAEAAYESQQEQLLAMRENRDKLTVLKRNVQTAQQAYDTVMQRYLTSQVESRASQTNVAVLNPAVAPRMPYRPNIALNILLSMVVGVMLGTAVVILLELADRRVRAPADLEINQDVPVLGELDRWRPTQPVMLGGSGGGRSLPAPD